MLDVLENLGALHLQNDGLVEKVDGLKMMIKTLPQIVYKTAGTEAQPEPVIEFMNSPNDDLQETLRKIQEKLLEIDSIKSKVKFYRKSFDFDLQCPL